MGHLSFSLIGLLKITENLTVYLLQMEYCLTTKVLQRRNFCNKKITKAISENIFQ